MYFGNYICKQDLSIVESQDKRSHKTISEKSTIDDLFESATCQKLISIRH